MHRADHPAGSVQDDAVEEWPWRNRGDRCLARERGTASFAWRVSIARVDQDAPFSIFEGIDRTIALIDGTGLNLSLPDGRTERLTQTSEPFAFPGEWPIVGRNVAGPTTDLNVMSRRGVFKHALRRRPPGRCSFPHNATHWLILPTSDTSLLAGTTELALRAFDTAMMGPIHHEGLTIDVPVGFFEISLNRAAQILKRELRKPFWESRERGVS
jgi:environmental stress-induced protein Ves